MQLEENTLVALSEAGRCSLSIFTSSASTGIIIGALIGAVTGALLVAWCLSSLAWVRRVATLSVLLILSVGFVTALVFDPETGIWGMGAPELQVWLLRVVFNSALKWCLRLVFAALLAAQQLARNVPTVAQ